MLNYILGLGVIERILKQVQGLLKNHVWSIFVKHWSGEESNEIQALITFETSVCRLLERFYKFLRWQAKDFVLALFQWLYNIHRADILVKWLTCIALSSRAAASQAIFKPIGRSPFISPHSFVKWIKSFGIALEKYGLVNLYFISFCMSFISSRLVKLRQHRS